jgi:hypothetical protein
MNDVATLAVSDSPTSAPDAASSLMDRRLRMLDRLAEAGLEIALAIEKRVKDAEPAQPLAELNVAAQAYARVARGVRLCVLLQEQLTRDDPDLLGDPLEAARQAEAARRQVQVDRTLRIVKRIAKDHCRKEGFELGAYAHEAKERLDNDDIYGLVATRPIGELVAMICDDLGLQPDWDHLAAEAWAQTEIESGAQGSPFLDWGDDEHDAVEDAAEPDVRPERPQWRPSSFQEACRAAAADPAIMAVAARRDSG